MSSFEHFVLIDFENVPKVDLALVEGKPVHVILLIGKTQKKLDTSLSLQMHRLSAQVTPAEVGASGRNALDLTLAYYLGQAVKDHPQAHFHIVSKDKDFEPLIAHLKTQGINVTRHDSFAAPPFLAVGKAPTKAPFPVADTPAPKTKAASKSQVVLRPKPAADRFEQLVEQLKKGINQPKKRATLEHHIATFYGNALSPGEVASKLELLVGRHVVRIDDKGKVTYFS